MKIKAAAKLSEDGTLRTGLEHDAIEGDGKKGFVTTDGTFLDREQAATVARDAGQLKDDYKDETSLHSHMVNFEDADEAETMDDDLKTKTVLVCSNPLFVSLAERLARDFGKVYLNVPHAGSFPTMNSGRVGYGLPGVELVDDIFGPHFDEVDLFVFPDLYHSQVQIHLEKLGKRVWGARNAEEIEIYRELCKEKMEELGLPVQPWKVVKGVAGLVEHLKAHENQHIKIDKWRGVTESFFAPSYEVVENKIDAIAHDLGGFKDVIEFIVEDDLPDCVEAGVDTYCVDGQYPENTLFGIEVKDCGYVGQMVKFSDIPEPLTRWNTSFAPLFAEYGIRSSVSNEVRIGKDLMPYMIDATIRAPSPPSELWQELFTNLSEIIWHGAAGKLVEPIPAGKWGVEVVLKSAWARENWQAVDYPEEFSKQIKLFNCVVIDGKRYVVTQNEDMIEIGAVVGWGDTLQEAMDHAKKAGESIKGYGIKFSMGPADTALEQIKELEEFGVSPFELDKLEK